MDTGSFGEGLVAVKYAQLGYRVVGRNVRLYAGRQVGELDLVVAKGGEIVFVEVKTRSTESFGQPAEAVDYRKRRRLLRAAQLYLLKNPRYAERPWRIDVAEVRVDRAENPVIIIPNAIEGY